VNTSFECGAAQYLNPAVHVRCPELSAEKLMRNNEKGRSFSTFPVASGWTQMWRFGLYQEMMPCGHARPLMLCENTMVCRKVVCNFPAKNSENK
jgi:hypothetical protein